MKTEEVHGMKNEEITQEVARLRRHLFDLKSQAVTEKLEDPTLLRKTRRDIARLLTEKQTRVIKQSEARS